MTWHCLRHLQQVNTERHEQVIPLVRVYACVCDRHSRFGANVLLKPKRRQRRRQTHSLKTVLGFAGSRVFSLKKQGV